MWFKLVAVVVPHHHRVQVVSSQTRAPMRLDVVHERDYALSLGSVDRNEQHEDHKAEHVALMCVSFNHFPRVVMVTATGYWLWVEQQQWLNG